MKSFDATGMEFGVFDDLPADKYHAMPGASASLLKCFWGEGVTPAHAKVGIDRELKEPTMPMFKGTMVHGLILEPESDLPGIAIFPETYPAPLGHQLVKSGKVAVGAPLPWHNGAKACKEWIAEQRGKGLTPMKKDDYKGVWGMARSVATHPIAGELFKDGESEVSMIVKDGQTGLPVRCRSDFAPKMTDEIIAFIERRLGVYRSDTTEFVPRRTFLIDVKTARNADIENFTKSAYQLGYHIQFALYLDVWNQTHPDDKRAKMLVVVVEQAFPHAVQVFEASEEFIERGRFWYSKLLRTLGDCVKTGVWPAYPLKIEELKTHRWKFSNDL